MNYHLNSHSRCPEDVADRAMGASTLRAFTFWAKPYRHPPYWYSPYCHPPYGHPPYIHSPYGCKPYGHPPYGLQLQGHQPCGLKTYVHPPYGHPPYMYIRCGNPVKKVVFNSKYEQHPNQGVGYGHTSKIKKLTPGIQKSPQPTSASFIHNVFGNPSSLITL